MKVGQERNPTTQALRRGPHLKMQNQGRILLLGRIFAAEGSALGGRPGAQSCHARERERCGGAAPGGTWRSAEGAVLARKRCGGVRT
jgi:hypothetical protein